MTLDPSLPLIWGSIPFFFILKECFYKIYTLFALHGLETYFQEKKKKKENYKNKTFFKYQFTVLGEL